MARKALFLNMTPDKKKILFLGDGLPVMTALAQYAQTVPAMLERYDCLGAFEYDKVSLMPSTVYLEADIVVFSLFRRYGVRYRAEGIPALEKRLEWGKLGILYSFSIPEAAESPLIWDVVGVSSLADKLDMLSSPDALSAEIQRLREVFRGALFTVDGHRR